MNDVDHHEAVITLASILDGSEPILHVTHDAEDGVWQFLNSKAVRTENARVVGWDTVLGIDPSLEELTDLPEGWVATRATADSPWERRKK